MTQSLDLVEEKVEAVLAELEQLRQSNSSLVLENGKLRAELARIKRGFHSAKLSQADQSDVTRTRLTAVLERINELESLVK